MENKEEKTITKSFNNFTLFAGICIGINIGILIAYIALIIL